MQVLLLDNNAKRHEDVMVAFIKSGFQVTATSSQLVAQTYLDHGVVDLLVMAEKVNGQLAHNTALYAEHRNPHLSTIMITDRLGSDVEELYELIPSVHCIVGTTVPGKTIVALGRASIASVSPVGDYSEESFNGFGAGRAVASGVRVAA